jgi:hypothetical protein
MKSDTLENNARNAINASCYRGNIAFLAFLAFLSGYYPNLILKSQIL